MSWMGAALRRWRMDRTGTLAFALLVLATAFTFGIAPRLLASAADQALRQEVGRASPTTRGLQFIQERRIGVDGRGPMYGPELVGARLEEGLSATVQELVDDRSMVVETPRLLVADGTMVSSTARLRIQPAAEERIRIVEGRRPTGAIRIDLVDWPSLAEPIGIRVFEASISVETARALRIETGTRLLLATDPLDLLAVGHDDVRTGVEVVGTFEPLDVDDPAWFEDHALFRPALRIVSPEVGFFDVAVLLAPEAYSPLMEATEESLLPLRYTWRYDLEADRLQSASVAGLVLDLRRLETVYPVAQTGPRRPDQTVLRTGFLRLLERQQAQWRSAQAVLAVASTGPIAVGLATLALVAALTARSRRDTLGAWLERGASAAQVSGAAAIEGLLLAVPAAAAAAVVAILAVPSGPAEPTIATAAGAAVAAVALLVAVSRPEEDGGRTALRIGRPPGATAPRRLVLEGLAVLLGVGGAALLRERSTTGIGPGGELESTDPLIAAVPALAGLAAAVLAARLIPLPVRLLATWAAMRRDLVPVLALRRTARGRTHGSVTMVLLGAATVAAFGAATVGHLDEGAERVSWYETGASLRATSEGGYLSAVLRQPSLPAAQAWAGAYRSNVPLGSRGGRVDLLAIDTQAYLRVVRGTPADPGLAGALVQATPVQALPAIVSPGINPAGTPLELGDRFEVSLDGRRQALVVADVRDTFPTLPPGSRFVVVARERVDAGRPGSPLPTTDLFIRTTDDRIADLRGVLDQVVPDLVLLSRAERAASIRSSPVGAAVAAGVAVAAAVAGAFTAIAVVAALALAGAARAVETSRLVMLGLGRRQAVGLAALEHGPTSIVAVAAGLVLGLGLFVFVRPGLGLAAIVGSSLEIPLAVQPGHLLAAVLGTIIISATGIAVSLVLQQRTEATTAVRRGTE